MKGLEKFVYAFRISNSKLLIAIRISAVLRFLARNQGYQFLHTHFEIRVVLLFNSCFINFVKLYFYLSIHTVVKIGLSTKATITC